MEHKLIQGGEQWLPFARSRVKVLHALNLPYASQQFEMPDGASVKVRISPFADHIILDSSPSGYQFFSTGPEVKTVPFLGFSASRGYAVVTDPKFKKSKLVGSSIESDNPLTITSTFPVKKIWQIQGIPEHVFYSRSSADAKLSTDRLINSWSSANQITGAGLRGGNRTAEFLKTADVDVNYDIAPTIGGKGLAPDSDWYKRGAMVTVKNSEFGDRRFIIMTDISNVFYAYPVDSDSDGERDERYLSQNIKTNVPGQFVRAIPSPLPPWCRKPSGSSRELWASGVRLKDLLTAVPQYRWAFNSLGTRACAVVFEDLAAFEGLPGLSEPPFFTDDRGVKYPIQETLLGLVEMDFAITITGKELIEFDFAVTVRQELRPSLTDKYILEADYAWEMPGKASADDLILMTGSVFHDSIERDLEDKRVNLYARVVKVDVQNATAATVLRSFVGFRTTQPYTVDSSKTPSTVDDYPREKRQAVSCAFLAVDLRVLAFSVKHSYLENALTWLDSGNILSRDFDGLSAQRIDTYMRDELVDEIVMSGSGSSIDLAMQQFIAETTVTGMFRMPLIERAKIGRLKPSGRISPVGDGYWGLELRLTPPYQGYILVDLIEGPFVNVGAYFYGLVVAFVLNTSMHSKFAVHPQGHWSLVTPPVSYHPGPVQAIDDGYNAGVGELFDPLTMLSARVDVVSFRAKPTAEQVEANLLGEEVRTTHLKLLNKALGKSWTAADFLPKWEKKFLSNSTTELWLLVDSVSTRAFELERKVRLYGPEYPFEYEQIPRPNTFNLQAGPVRFLGFYDGTPLNQISDKTTILGGSTLFI